MSSAYASVVRSDICAELRTTDDVVHAGQNFGIDAGSIRSIVQWRPCNEISGTRAIVLIGTCLRASQ